MFFKHFGDSIFLAILIKCLFTMSFPYNASTCTSQDNLLSRWTPKNFVLSTSGIGSSSSVTLKGGVFQNHIITVFDKFNDNWFALNHIDINSKSLFNEYSRNHFVLCVHNSVVSSANNINHPYSSSKCTSLLYKINNNRLRQDPWAIP